ncbi:rRNA maturation RNase YbeY [Helicobacter sp.]|uniref:rRNA maturation RNase YbeY n=1 Tax=Helicobacter sp. TaxID=218 RepID=UPI0038908F82
MSESILSIIDSTECLDSKILENLRRELFAIIDLMQNLDSRITREGLDSGDLTRSLAHDLKNFSRREIELIFVNEQEIRALNAGHLGREYATDVLSFPIMQEWVADVDSSVESGVEDLGVPCAPLGSIVINLPLCVRMSEKLGHTLVQEICLLFVHALLHLLGFDHERDSGEHRMLESTIITLAKLPPSLIDRSSEPCS